MKFGRAIILVAVALLITAISALWLMLFISTIDSFTIEEIGEESVSCVDKYNRPFEDEMCTETIYCSKLGMAAEVKCKDVLGGLDE